MTGDDLKYLRGLTGLGVVEFGRALGYEGNDNTVSVTMRRYENDGRKIPPLVARLALFIAQRGVPGSWIGREDHLWGMDGPAPDRFIALFKSVGSP